jgi:hypothetical protein
MIAIQHGSIDSYSKAIINGKVISFDNRTQFLIQSGSDAKASYKTDYKVTGNLNKALSFFINLYSFKKRLILARDVQDRSKQLKFDFCHKKSHQTKRLVLLRSVQYHV